MKYFQAARLFVLVVCVSSQAAADGFFSPYASSHWFAQRESAPEFIEKAMEELRRRIVLARERIAGAAPQLTELSSQLVAIQNRMRDQHRRNAADFYGVASMAVFYLPQRFRLTQWLDEVERERIKFLEKSRALEIPPIAEDGSNKAQVEAIQEARGRMYVDWHRVVERCSGTTSWFFAPETLKTQERFNYVLLKSALPLCDLGQQKPVGLNLIHVDDGSSQFLHRGRSSYFLNYSFLFASISPEWPLQGDPASSTLLEFQRDGLQGSDVEISHASPYFNLYHDTDVIAAMLDGKSNGMPLEIVLMFKPWYRPFARLAPRYHSGHHRLTTYYGAFKGDWGSTRWEPAASDFHCARALRDSLTPERPWNRRMTEGELLAEALRAPK